MPALKAKVQDTGKSMVTCCDAAEAGGCRSQRSPISLKTHVSPARIGVTISGHAGKLPAAPPAWSTRSYPAVVCQDTVAKWDLGARCSCDHFLHVS